MMALGFAALNTRFADLPWRVFAVIVTLFAIGFAFAAARNVLAESTGWPPVLALLTGVLAPALAAGSAAFLFDRNDAPRLAGFFEAAALVFALTAGHLLIRTAFAGGAPLLQPVSFVEAASHCSLWFTASLAIAARLAHGATSVRETAARHLATLALAGLIVSGVLWLASAWPRAPEGAWFGRESLAFLIPSVLLWAHWTFWRRRKADKRTRVAFAAAAASLSVFALLEITALPIPLWGKIIAAMFFAATALSVNFLRGVTSSGEPLRLREKSPSPTAPQAAR
jgi:hypothetical protein